MDTIVNGTEEMLLNELTYKLPKSAQYIQDKRHVTFYADGSNIYKPQAGTRTVRFRLSGEGWVNPDSLMINYDTVNNLVSSPTTTPKVKLLPLSSYGWFSRARLIIRGTIVHDYTEYARIHYLFESLLKERSKRDNDNIAGYGINIEQMTQYDPNNPNGGGGGIINRQNTSFKPYFGLFKAGRFLPLQYCPIEIEFELNQDIYANLMRVNDKIIYAAGATKNASEDFQLENFMINVEVLTFDSEVENNFYQHMLSGKSLNIHHMNIYSNVQTLTNPKDFQINISRSLTKLTSVYASFIRNTYSVGDRGKYSKLRENTDFFSIIAGDYTSAPDADINLFNNDLEIISMQLTIGSKNFPEMPIRSHSQAYSYLMNCMTDDMRVSFDGRDYRKDSFVAGFCIEKHSGVAFSGLDTRNSMITFKFKANTLSDATENAKHNPEKIHIILENSQILQINATGVELFE